MSFSGLKKLESLGLSHNKLNGSIPLTFVKLNELTILDVSNNELAGSILVSGQMSTMTDPGFYANNSGLCGFQIEVPCSAPSPGELISESVNDEGEEGLILFERMLFWYAVGLLVPVPIAYFAIFL